MWRSVGLHFFLNHSFFFGVFLFMCEVLADLKWWKGILLPLCPSLYSRWGLFRVNTSNSFAFQNSSAGQCLGCCISFLCYRPARFEKRHRAMKAMRQPLKQILPGVGKQIAGVISTGLGPRQKWVQILTLERESLMECSGLFTRKHKIV